MESQPDKSPLIVIVGETASGKSALALDIARQFNGEIIAADSRTIYKGMDIGTAKPSLDEQRLVKHYLLDIVTPDQPFTAADFKQRAVAAIHDICARGKLPVLVGGTGLYIDAVIYDFTFNPKPNDAQRQALQNLSVKELQALLQEQGIPLPLNAKNPRHLIRQVETGGSAISDRQLRMNTLVLGMQPGREQLEARIHDRITSMFKQGLEQEARVLFEQYGLSCRALQTIGYAEFLPYFDGQVSLQDVQIAIEKNTLQYAKRQRTWFRRNKSIHWLDKKEQSVDLMTTFLNK